MPDSDHTCDDLLGGLIRLTQPREGQRASADAVMLAAAVTARPGQRVLELGCGSGVGMLCLAARVPEVTITGIELQADLVTLCAGNIADNHLADRLTVQAGDIRQPLEGLAAGSFDHVFANPPYFNATRHRASPHAGRATARSESEEADLGQWIAALLRYARPGGCITLIHKADRLADLLGGLNGKTGAIRVIPLCSRTGQPAKRVILSAVKGSKAPLILEAGVVLHQPDGQYLPEIEAVLRTGAAFPV
jgi:tRNA1(Val) A37 N6-methylase TrmN6